MVEHHPAHERAPPWLQRTNSGADSGIVSAHSIAELYSVLTTLPVQPRISPGVARRLIEENVLSSCGVVALSRNDYVDLLAHLVSLEIVGGTTYDALILRAATKVDVDRIVTLNERHFRQAYPPLADKLAAP